MQTYKILLAFGTFSILIYLAKNDDNVENEEMDYLRRFGYLKRESRFLSGMTQKDVLTSAITGLQRMAGLEQTGVMDEMTRKVMKMPRCGVSDIQTADEHRRKRYLLAGAKWFTEDLTYRFVNYPAGHSQVQVEQTIEKAFQYWQNESLLTFTRTYHKSLIDVAFYKKSHGDQDAFDGLGGTLAHAFYPSRSTLGGDVHFDDDEEWTFNEYKGTNLLQVAVHELGHSLGLSHSDVKGSIMAPFYRDYDPNLKLHDDDIKAIRSLYGSPNKRNYTTPKSYTTPPIFRGICAVKRPKAIFSLVDLLFVFEGDRVYIMKGLFDSKAKSQNPSLIFSQFPKIVDAALALEGFYDSLGTKLHIIYFFSGSNIWKYIFQRKPFGFILFRDYPKLISMEFPGVPSNLDAAFEWNANGKQYFFKENQYYRFSESLSRVPSTYPRPITNWNLNIDKVDTVFQYPSGSLSNLYFVYDGQVYKYDYSKDGIAFGYPKPWQWLVGCDSNEPLKKMMIESFTEASPITVANFTTLLVSVLSVCYCLSSRFSF